MTSRQEVFYFYFVLDELRQQKVRAAAREKLSTVSSR
jgi:hypothetical protein